MNLIREIWNDNSLLGIIIRGTFHKPGIHFFTDSSFSQQLAYMNHAPGHHIQAHYHNPVRREVRMTQEALFVRKGKLRVDFYDGQQQYLESYLLCEGDVILLTGGCHGFEVIEEVELVEVKQGPYSGDRDKTLINAVSADQVKIID